MRTHWVIFLIFLFLLMMNFGCQEDKESKQVDDFEIINQPEMMDLLHVKSDKLRRPLIISGGATFPVCQVLFNLHLENLASDAQKEHFDFAHEYRFIEDMSGIENKEEKLWQRIKIIGALTAHKNKKIIDIGAGTCGLVPWLSEGGVEALGADIWYDTRVAIPKQIYSHGQSDFMELFRSLHKDKLTMDKDMGDATQLKGIPDDAYDFVLSHMLFGDLNAESQQKMIEQAWRVCKKGGTIRLATDISYLDKEGKAEFKKRIVQYIKAAAKKYSGSFDATIIGLDSASKRKFREIDSEWYKNYHYNLGGDFEPVELALVRFAKNNPNETPYYINAFPSKAFIKTAFQAQRNLQGQYTFTVSLHVVLIIINKN